MSIAEVLLTDFALSDAQCDAVNGYFNTRYALAL